MLISNICGYYYIYDSNYAFESLSFRRYKRQVSKKIIKRNTKGEKFMIKIVGLGPGAPEALTYGAIKALEDSDNLFFRTEKHPTVDYLKEN